MARRARPRKPVVASGVNRLTPRLPADKRKTYAIDAAGDPRAVPARCVDVDCGMYANGFVVRVDESSVLGQAQAHHIRYVSRRRYSEARDGGLTVFAFKPGTECFKPHRAPLYLVRGGDHRGNPRGLRRVHTRPEHWAEDLQEHTDALGRAREG